MKNCIILLASLLAFASCASSRYALVVENNSAIAREAEIIEVELDRAEDYIVLDAEGAEVSSQVTYQGNLIFPVTIDANSSQKYTLRQGERREVDTIAVGRVYPEHYDDIGWENDKIGFRMYAPGAVADGLELYGYDIFTKRSKTPVLDILYSTQFDPEYKKLRQKYNAAKAKQGQIITNAISYHMDHGLGMDYYKVGPTLGCGALAIHDSEGFHYPTYYTSFEVLDEGGLRYTFKVGYDPVVIDGEKIVETRIITLDAGSHFNKVYVEYNNLTKSKDVVAGLVLRDTGKLTALGDNYVAYAERRNAYGWQTYNGIIFAKKRPTRLNLFDAEDKKAHGGAYGYAQIESEYTPGQGVEYYMGAGWNRWGFPTPQSWFDFMEVQAEAKLHPLKYSIKAKMW